MKNSAGERLLVLAEELGALRYGKFRLSSGGESKYYFDGRLLTLHAEAASLIADVFLSWAVKAGARGIGGPTLGADPIVGGVVARSHQKESPLSGFIVRDKQKDHGTGRSIEGPLPRGLPVAIVDDVCTSGGALFRAIAAVESLQCQVKAVLVILDRKQGGSEAVRRQGYHFQALLEADQEGNVRLSHPRAGSP